MIAVELVIRRLMGEYEFVIIPGFGALLSHQVPATFDTHSGIFSPPAKRLAFNEYLKLDDGLLANSISREQNLTHQEAVDCVKNYSDRLRSELEREGQAVIPGIGVFSRNVEGKPVFEPDLGKHFKDDWYGFEKFKATEIMRAEPVVHTPASEIQEVIEVVESEEAAPRSIRWTSWAAAAVLSGLMIGLSYFLVNSPTGTIQSTLNPFKELFARKEVVKDEPEVVETEVEEEAVSIDSLSLIPDASVDAPVVSADSVAEVKNEPEVKVAQPTEIDYKSKKFLVVAGTFKGTRQAGILLEQLQSKGVTTATIIPQDQFSKKVKVAVNGFDNEKEAYQSAAGLKSVIGEVGWVYKRP
ncbi:HU domain-containing protein [Dyadobacter sandarakinus]|uniref:SPOR domain-containing protein n=1 Tax=Dyadobacter sandarakinus TaxID=2747268 RepID=A0ABX7I3R5_9BACT|nr:SPOR domain-containing protein [Dyadobacter sandarakinus]QRR00445.1 SPOR domain-containing protein [Dyadobacter sandarakinus]